METESTVQEETSQKLAIEVLNIIAHYVPHHTYAFPRPSGPNQGHDIWLHDYIAEAIAVLKDGRTPKLSSMTPEAKQAAIAKFCGTYDQWVIIKRGFYYRPDAKGYTSDVNEAWKVPLHVARAHEYKHDEPVTIERAPFPDYLGSLDAMHEAEERLGAGDLGTEFQRHLGTITSSSLGDKWYAIHAKACDRADAFLLAIKAANL